MNKASKEINGLDRIDVCQLSDAENFATYKLLLPKNIQIEIDNTGQVVTRGLGDLDLKRKDLLTYIKIVDPLNLIYKTTKVVMPRTYAESLNPIPEHISVQCLLFSKINEQDANFINDKIQNDEYGKTAYDKFFISNKKQPKVAQGNLIYIMNRRVGGWDGNVDRPVIELLCAGGHLQTLFNEKSGKFENADLLDNLIREFQEELKIKLNKEQIAIFGGFHNKKSNELVVLCGAFVPSNNIEKIYNNSKNNFQENIDGIYVGNFEEVMSIYAKHAEFFAGGEKAKPSNFPSQELLMKKVFKFLKQ